MRPVAHPVACPGVTLSVHPQMSDIVTQSLVRTGMWEPVETELMIRLLKPGMTMVDVGAKGETEREGVAEAIIRMQPATLERIKTGQIENSHKFEHK